ncbi:MAG: hypothetical protein HKN73_17685 [Gemmatimonadetes bacterium]|nr:hypothetical protein [Gemmatimonadota bacterium]
MTEYDSYRFHDNQIHGIAFRAADPDLGDWTSDLILDIDHVLEWVRDGDRIQFRVQPATLTFHGVTDLRLRLDGTVDGHSIGVALPWILEIERDHPLEPPRDPGRPAYAWRIVLASTPDGEISFGSWGYTLELRGEPVLQDEQGLTFAQRS